MQDFTLPIECIGNVPAQSAFLESGSHMSEAMGRVGKDFTNYVAFWKDVKVVD